MHSDVAAGAIGDALAGYVRWALFWLSLGALFVGAGGGAALSAFLHSVLATWETWTVALPGAGWAFLIGLVALWASMDGRRRYVFFGRR